MALKTLTVGQIRKLFDGLPDEQEVLFVESNDGMAYEITDVEPLTVMDTATGKQVLTIEFGVDPDRWFGFDEDENIDSNDADDSLDD